MWNNDHNSHKSKEVTCIFASIRGVIFVTNMAAFLLVLLLLLLLFLSACSETHEERFADDTWRRTEDIVRPRLHGAGWIFDRLKDLTGHFVHRKPFNIIALICSHETDEPGLLFQWFYQLSMCYFTKSKNAITPLPCKDLEGQAVCTAPV